MSMSRSMEAVNQFFPPWKLSRLRITVLRVVFKSHLPRQIRSTLCTVDTSLGHMKHVTANLSIECFKPGACDSWIKVNSCTLTSKTTAVPDHNLFSAGLRYMLWTLRCHLAWW
ncbi:unnamed protein product [Dicrocoelium dendriticum]|nr:unnamed protein product [Dicrocoelium dendriticum]